MAHKLALQPVSAAFNPVVTLVERILGVLTTEAIAIIPAQVVGGLVERKRFARFRGTA
jgi:glycerol uptake facilitator-like aquaporin